MVDDGPDTRTRILDAAEQAFAEAGLAGARVAAIAERADVNKAMLYYYFDSKEALYTAVFERVFDQIVAMVTALGSEAGGPTRTTFEEFLAGYRQVLLEHPAFVRLIVRGVLDGANDVFPIMRPRVERVVPLISAVVAKGQAQGVFNPTVAPPLVAPILVSTMVFFAIAHPLLSQITNLPVDTLEAMWRDNAKELLMNGLLARKGEET